MLYDLAYMWNPKKKKMLRERTDMWLPEVESGREKWVKETKGLKKEKSKYSTLLNNTEKYLTITQQFVIIFYRTQTVKRLSTMRETQIRALGWEDPLEKEMAIHSSTIA